ncbi:MAG: septum site-determining protein MinC [Succinivibrionaceae bacterium]|nr:septum site-determining protein MinC [Ruminobacter sp.]MDY5778767.1 septum site-determining protein MinC [Succinivibrionaceae bacterium]MEE1340931.1 septum site-determining protein MinC [Succinivibrionaceae bacterium]
MSNVSLNILDYSIPTLTLSDLSKKSLESALNSKKGTDNLSLWLMSQPIVLNIAKVSNFDSTKINLNEIQNIAQKCGFYICGITAGDNKDLENELGTLGVHPFVQKATKSRKSQENTDEAAKENQEAKESQDTSLASQEENKVEETKEVKPTKEEEVTPPPVNMSTTMIHYGNIRSGSQIYAKGKSLIVIGNVGNGADAIADDCVYVFGQALGRVIAGASGNTQSVIYCSHFDPQLISIAGTYKASEDINEEIINKRVLASLNANSFNFDVKD